MLISRIMRATILKSATFRKLWFSAEGQIVRRLSQQTTQTSYPETAVVLGRGRSLSEFVSMAPSYPDVIVANFQNRDLDESSLRSALQKRRIHFVGNIVEPTLPFRSIRGLTIGDVFFGRPDVPSTHKFGQKRWAFNLNRYGKNVKYFPASLAEGFDLYKNVGLLSIYLAAAEWKVKECALFGYDFYETDYHSQSLLQKMGSVEAVEAHRTAGQEIKKQLIGLVERYPETSFTIFTYSEILDPPSNLTVERLSA